VNWQDPNGMVTTVVQEIHSVMVCQIQSKTMVLKNVSFKLFCKQYFVFRLVFPLCCFKPFSENNML